jgi:hypothetical protein
VALNKYSGQAEKESVLSETILWGCPVTNIKATLPFNRMRQDFAAFKKRPRGPALARPKGHNWKCGVVLRLRREPGNADLKDCDGPDQHNCGRPGRKYKKNIAIH